MENLENFIQKFPIYQYAFLPADKIAFADKIRQQCKHQCPHYGTSWGCPPAVGKLEKCKENALRYSNLLLFSTFTEISPEKEERQRAEAMREHDRLTRIVGDHMKETGYLTYVLSSGRCRKCEKCTFPRDLCKYPEEMYPCIESHGIVISDLAKQCNMDYYMGAQFPLMFSMIFFSL